MRKRKKIYKNHKRAKNLQNKIYHLFVLLVKEVLLQLKNMLVINVRHVIKE